MHDDFVSLVQMSTNPANGDVRMFLAKLIRKYRQSDSRLAEAIDEALRKSQCGATCTSVLRSNGTHNAVPDKPIPIDEDTRLSLIRVYSDSDNIEQPLLPLELLCQIEAIILEQENRDRLAAMGIGPTKSAIFVGPPGVGKTITARWMANKLGKPLWVLDLAAVMSSRLGKTGNNLRIALDYAKSSPAVLMLDEIDAIAKRRSDNSDVGELKRLVTVILQEVDLWPDTSLLLAATNHPDLIDPALWRRFGAVLHFGYPREAETKAAIQRFFAKDLEKYSKWIAPISTAMRKQSLSDVERVINIFRRNAALNRLTEQDFVMFLLNQGRECLTKQDRREFAIELAKTNMSLSQVQQLTGVSRDTLRKHIGVSVSKKNYRRSK